MTIRTRPFNGEADLSAMLALAAEFPAENLYLVDLPYRFSSWALDEPANINLWVDADGRLLGWALLQKPFWSMDYAFTPHYGPALQAEMLDWMVRRAVQCKGTPWELPAWYITAFADQADRVRALQAAGFANQVDAGEDAWSKVFMRRPAGLPVAAYRVPPGFNVRALDGQGEVNAYTELHREVFGTKNMTAEWRARSLLRPEYRPDLDVVVSAPDGRLAAFCIGWLLHIPGLGRVGQIEPLGCRAEFRRFALGRVALAEVLRRLQAAGADSVVVQTDNYRDTAMRLYEHMGFTVEREVHVFCREFAG